MAWPFGGANIPGPSGSSAVGFTRFDVTDHTGHTARRIPVTAWYPTTIDRGPLEPTLDDELREALAELTHVPKFLLPANPSFSVIDAPAAPGKSPVLIFNHGFGSFQKESQSLMEELASHGYLVLSVGHPHDSLVVQFADGASVHHDRERPSWKAFRAGAKGLEQHVRDTAPLLDRARGATEVSQLREVMDELEQQPGYAVLRPVLDTWAEDTRGVIQSLRALDEGQWTFVLRGAVDADQVGVFGHSLGGTLAGQLAMAERTVKAAMNFDGAQLFGEARNAPTIGLRVPVCCLYADSTPVGKTVVKTEGMNDALVTHGPTGSCSAVLVGAGHLNFTDLNNVKLASRALGSIVPETMARTLRAITVGFFDTHLRGKTFGAFTPSPSVRVLCPPR